MSILSILAILSDFGFWTQVAILDLDTSGQFWVWTLETDFGFWTLVADFAFLTLAADFAFGPY